MNKLRKGFTIVELLVVLAIIGILATIAIVNYNSSQQRARDTQRQADLERIAQALEMYRAENKKYPDNDTNGGWITVGGTLSQALVGLSGSPAGFLDKLPCDNYTNTSRTCTSLGERTGYVYFRKDAVADGQGNTLPGETSAGKSYYGLYTALERTPQGLNLDPFDSKVFEFFEADNVNYVSGLKLP